MKRLTQLKRPTKFQMKRQRTRPLTRQLIAVLASITLAAAALATAQPASAHWHAMRAHPVRCPCYFPAWAWGDYPMRAPGVACVWHREPNGWWRDCI